MSKLKSNRQSNIDPRGWTIKNFPAHERAVATQAAKQSRMQIGKWIEQTIRMRLEAGDRAIPPAAETSDVGSAPERQWCIKGVPRPSRSAVREAADQLGLHNGEWLAGAIRLRMQVDNREPVTSRDQNLPSRSTADRLVEICGEVAKLAQTVANERLAASMAPSAQRDRATVIFVIMGDGPDRLRVSG